MRAAPGFSLLELLTVLGIASILMLFVGLGMSGFTDRVNVQGESVRFRDVLLRARNLALVTGQCVTVDVQAQQVTVMAYAATPACAAPFGAPTSTETTTFANGVTLSQFSTGNPLVFNTDGGTVTTAVSKMTLSGSSRSFGYNVYPAIGQVRFQ